MCLVPVKMSTDSVHSRRQSTEVLTVTDPFLDVGYLLLPSCKQDHLQTEARKTWVSHFHQNWPSGCLQQNMDTPRAAVVIQNCSGTIAAELWSMYSAPCVFPSPPQQCALLVWLWLRIYPVYLMLGGVPVTGHRLPYLLVLQSQYNSLGRDKSAAPWIFRSSALLPCEEIHWLLVERSSVLVQESSQGQLIRDQHSLWVAHSPEVEMQDLI